MPLLNAYIVVNPISGIGKQKVIEKYAEKYIDSSKINYQIVYTAYAGHITQIAAEAVKNNVDIFIAVGGDGTINEAVHSLVNSNVTLAIVPTGSGNGLARHLKIPLTLQKALTLINKNNSIHIDTIKINEHVFVNVAGLGFDGLVANKFANYGKRGLWSYVKICMNEYLNYDNFKIEFVLKNEVFIEKNLFLFSIANASQFGNNATISPEADLKDGLMDIVAVKEIPWYYLPVFAINMFTKQLKENRYIKLYKANSIILKVKSSTRAHIDGEPIIIDKDQIIKVIPLSLKVLVP